MSPYCSGDSLEARETNETIRKENAHLFAGIEEELVRFDTIADRATDEGEPVEDDWGLVRVLEQQLAQNIDHDRQGDKRQRANRDECENGLRRAVLAELVEEAGEETHGGRRSIRGEKKIKDTREKNSQCLRGQGEWREEEIEPRTSRRWVPPSLPLELDRETGR